MLNGASSSSSYSTSAIEGFKGITISSAITKFSFTSTKIER